MNTTEEPIELTQDENEQVSAGGGGESEIDAILFAIKARDAETAKKIYKTYLELGWLTETEIMVVKKCFFFTFGYDIDA